MKSFAEHLAEDRRLVIVRALEAFAGYEANESVLLTILDEFGHRMSRDQMRTELAWLKEQGLVTLEEIATLQIATLTQRGLETAQGIVTTPGVKRPSPGAP
jgi:hypothetical protein